MLTDRQRQTYIAHLIRDSPDRALRKQREAPARAIEPIAAPELPRNMRHRLAHLVGCSSQAMTAAVDNSRRASITKTQTSAETMPTPSKPLLSTDAGTPHGSSPTGPASRS